jgi:hypothetical protein
MMPLPLRPSNQKSGVCPWKAETFSQETGGQNRKRPYGVEFRHASEHNAPRDSKRMNAPLRLATLLVFSAVIVTAPRARAQKPEEPADHELEELGVNPYTAPSVAEIFQQLDDLRPLPFDELKRDFPQATHSSREQMGMVFGGLVADGFLIVESQRKNLVEDLGRILLRQARSLGVGDRVMRHSASLTELGKKGEWAAVRAELISTQEDVEEAMTQLRDQKMAHLISMGGWLRGLEISAGAVEKNYTSDRAAVLWQRDLINYYAEEMKTLPPSVAHQPLFEKIRAGVEGIRTLLNQTPESPPLADVKSLHAQAKSLNVLIAAAD